MRSYDVVVVGGGPGGAVAAKTAAELGLDTVFFERGRRSGDKNASGCGLGPRLWRDFDFMAGLDRSVCPSLRRGRALRHYVVDAGDRHVATVVTKPTASVGYEPAKSWITTNVYRGELDRWLAELAVAAGATQRTSTLITDVVREHGRVVGVVDEDGERTLGRVVIGADGAVSTVARGAGLRERWGREEVTLVVQYDFEVPPDRIERVMGEETLGIWWGVGFPTAYQVFFGDGFHIGLGNWLDRWSRDPRRDLDHVVGLPCFQQLVDKLDARPREVHAHLLPWLSDPGRTYTDNVLLVGDAGGFPCPLEAEGVYPAMVTGRIAAEVAAEAIRDGDTSREALHRYEERWRASSVGVEFETGPELVELWKHLPFSPREGMAWAVPLATELLGGAFDWSEPHSVWARQMVREVRSHWPRAAPYVATKLIPFLTASLRDEPGTLGLRLGLRALALAIRLGSALRRVLPGGDPGRAS